MRERMNGRNQNMNQRQQMEWVMMLGFCAYDMLLYLDTHANDEKAATYYKECNDAYQNAKEAYEMKYGPLTMYTTMERGDGWNWENGKLQWEGVV